MSRQGWAKYEEGLLLGGKWLPITSRIVFANAPALRCADALVSGVRGRRVLENYGFPLRARSVEGASLDDPLSMLLPLEAPESWRYLILPTASPDWCAIFDSIWSAEQISSTNAKPAPASALAHPWIFATSIPAHLQSKQGTTSCGLFRSSRKRAHPHHRTSSTRPDRPYCCRNM